MHKTSWDLTLILKDDSQEAIHKIFTDQLQSAQCFNDKWATRSDYLETPQSLLEALDDYERFQSVFGTDTKVGYFFNLKSSLDESDPDIKAWLNKIHDQSLKVDNLLRFFLLKVAKIEREKQKLFLNSPALGKYKHFLEKIFAEGKHTLSEEQEKILAYKSPYCHSNWVKMTSSFLSRESGKILSEDGKEIEANFSQLLNFINSKDQQIRDSAAKELNRVFFKNVDVAENELNSILGNKKSNDELRGFNRPDAERHLSDDVDSSVVDCLLTTISNNFTIAHKFYALKAKLLGKKILAYHERNVEYGAVIKTYTFQQSTDLVGKVFKDLDSEFCDILENFLVNGQIDVFPKTNKRSGAFCSYYLKSLPTYVFLNHSERLDNVLTLAHEMGHAINDELMKRSQNFLNFSTPLSTAEVASTFMEDFVFVRLLNEANDEERLSLMMAKLNDDISTVFRQVACYLFEKDLHENYKKKGYLSKNDIGELFQKHMASYMGTFVEQSPGCENWWVYWGHIRHFFYVYSYASGQLISKSLQSAVKKDKRFIIHVKKFLSAGSSASPKEIFAELGVDITNGNFWQSGVSEIENLLRETELLARRLGKI